MNFGDVETIFRSEGARVLATLIRVLGDFDLAEDVRQEAFAAAIEQWPQSGIPDNAFAWLVRAGRNKAIDRIRRRVLHAQVIGHGEHGIDACAGPEVDEDTTFADDRLRLIFTCCHPALNIDAQIALTLHTVCDIETPAVARAFLVSEETMAQRLVRAKRKIREAKIPYETPAQPLLNERMDGVLAVIYLIFTEGYAVSSGPDLIRDDLCAEAIRLGRLLNALLPDRNDVLGLLALMLLHDSRRAARISAAGDVVLLEFQDRARWDKAQIAEGLALVDRSLRNTEKVSAYAVEAAIAALHAKAPRHDLTDWRQIAGLYEVLLRLKPTAVIELNHAVAVAMVDGPDKALALVDSLASRGTLRDYALLHAARANLLERLGRNAEAREAYTAALALTRSEPERRFLEKQSRRLA